MAERVKTILNLSIELPHIGSAQQRLIQVRLGNRELLIKTKCPREDRLSEGNMKLIKQATIDTLLYVAKNPGCRSHPLDSTLVNDLVENGCLIGIDQTNNQILRRFPYLFTNLRITVSGREKLAKLISESEKEKKMQATKNLIPLLGVVLLLSIARHSGIFS